MNFIFFHKIYFINSKTKIQINAITQDILIPLPSKNPKNEPKAALKAFEMSEES